MSLGSRPPLAAMLLIAQGVRPAEEAPQARDPGPPQQALVPLGLRLKTSLAWATL